jgi:predicted methyltransferase
MMSYAKKRSTDYSWDEQVVNNIKVKTAHFFKLPIPIAQTDDQIEMSEKQQELIEFAKSNGWSTKIWESDIELEIYIRKVAKTELGK